MIMSDLSRSLVDAAAEAIRAAVHMPGSRAQARAAVAATLDALDEELARRFAVDGEPIMLPALAAEVREARDE